MSFSTIHIIFNLSVLIPAVAILLKKRSDVYSVWPFFAYIYIGLANDLFGYWRVLRQQGNMVSANVYTLLAFILLVIQFSMWSRKPILRFWVIISAGIVVWFVDNIALHSLKDNNSLFRMFYAISIVLLSMDLINRLIAFERNPLLTNPVFMICIGFILFFGCKAFLEAFNIVDAGFSSFFYKRLFFILSIINGLSNLLYAYAILCIPRKREFTLPY